MEETNDLCSEQNRMRIVIGQKAKLTLLIQYKRFAFRLPPTYSLLDILALLTWLMKFNNEVKTK